MSKVHHRLERSPNPLKPGKLFAIIRGDRKDPILPWTEHLNHSIGDLLSGLARHFVDARQPGLAVRQGDEQVSAPLARDGVRFPVSKPLALLHDLGSFFDARAL